MESIFRYEKHLIVLILEKWKSRKRKVEKVEKGLSNIQRILTLYKIIYKVNIHKPAGHCPMQDHKGENTCSERWALCPLPPSSFILICSDTLWLYGKPNK